ncbi:MAG: EI24 domain-containing protein [Spirochaetes bacterium]|jgi:uncharacterized protein involved in cysteine biosynthesis|nr:EI24 domain-containing protein [Spirochaetota bacterium]
MRLNEIFIDGAEIKGAFAAGFLSVFRALKTAFRKGVRPFFIIPFLINAAVLTSVFYFSYMKLRPVFLSLFAGEEWYFTLLRVVAGPLLIGLLAFLTVIFYSIAGSIITAPFMDLLSARTEEALTSGGTDVRFSIRRIFTDIIRVAANVIRLLFMLALVNVLILFVNIIPVAGSALYAVLSFCATSFFLGFQFYDLPLERRRYSFGDKIKICWRYKTMVIGTGAGFMAASFLPVFGFLALNLGAVGATVLFVDRIKPCLKPVVA